MFFVPVPYYLFLLATAITAFIAALAAGKQWLLIPYYYISKLEFSFNISFAGLLLHLCIFHIYISLAGQTTYEYIRAQKAATEQAERQAETEDQTQIIRTDTPQVKYGGDSSCDCQVWRGNKVGPEDGKIQVTGKKDEIVIET